MIQASNPFSNLLRATISYPLLAVGEFLVDAGDRITTFAAWLLLDE